jgi:hypothetical protein
MKRKEFLKKGVKGIIGISALGPFLDACTKIETSAGAPDLNGTAISNAAAPFPWPIQNTTYRTLLPRHGTYGLGPYGGDGSHPENPVKNATRVYFINTTASGNTGTYDPVTRVGYGTVRWCFGHTTAQANGEGGPPQPNSKIIIPLVSGVVTLNRKFSPSEDYTEYWGQFAPHPGLWFRNSAPASNHSHVLYWHLPSYVGDDAGDPAYNNRDAGTTGSGTLTGNAWINCSFAWSIDELFDAYNPSLLSHSWLYSMFLEPLGYSRHTDVDSDPNSDPEYHGFGPLVGTSNGASNADKIAFQRCVFAHAQSRNPLVLVKRFAMAECLTYNWGRLAQGTLNGTTGSGAGVGFGKAAEVTKANIISCGWIRGPQNGNAHNIICGSTDFSNFPGSKLYLANNAVYGYTIAAQSNLVNNGYAGNYTGAKNGHFPANFLSPGILTESIPIGWGNNFENVYRPWANPLRPTTAEWQNYIALMRSSCGPWPARRTNAQGREGKIFDQMLAAVNGNTAGMGGQVNSVAGTAHPNTWPTNRIVAPNAGGWGQLPAQLVTVDPANPGSHWVARIMSVAEGRDVPYTSGTFSNGLSKAGYSPLRALAIEQHWYVGGK